MWDLTSFLEGFAIDSIVLSVLLVVLGPIVIERWIRVRAFGVFRDVMEDPRMNELIQRFVVQRVAGNFGGRPRSLGSVIKGVVAQGVAEVGGNLVAQVFRGFQRPGQLQLPEPGQGTPSNPIVISP